EQLGRIQFHSSLLCASDPRSDYFGEEFGMKRKSNNFDTKQEEKKMKVSAERQDLQSRPDDEGFYNFPVRLPIELHTHILSFLHQRDLLRSGVTSRSWRQAAEILWKTTP